MKLHLAETPFFFARKFYDNRPFDFSPSSDQKEKTSDNFQKSDSSDQKGLPKFYDSEKVAKSL